MSKTWPPVYTIRRSQRARRVLLKVSSNGLEVVLPQGYKQQYTLANLLTTHRKWIEEQLLKVSQLAPQCIELPKEIKLLALAKQYTVAYLETENRQKIVESIEHKITIMGKNTQPETCNLLKKWLFTKAKHYLPELLEIYSKTYNLPYNRVTIKRQKTRWGSCTAQKSINLNYQLLLLPLELARYVIIHELCHTKELNHSINFWRLVASMDPNWQQHRQQLRDFKKFMPAWILE
ncbi:MAG: hypothetical protein K0S11_1618 [Gammaproteobacteria bacterium]|jgi:predicted metal-dependent hydrolase|nr:hypothetical protein [Gammaproteobacteria bacterium]